MNTPQPIKHWYEINPARLEMEKIAMSSLFPDFGLSIVDGDRLRFTGVLTSDKFNNREGYQVNVDYYDLSTDGNPAIVISPDYPDFNALFPADSPHTEEIRHKLLDQQAIDMKCIRRADAVSDGRTIQTAASLLKTTIDWFTDYEAEKERVAQEIKTEDAKTQRRREMRHKIADALRRGEQISLWSGGEYKPEPRAEIILGKVEEYLVEPDNDFLPDESEIEAGWSLDTINDLFTCSAKKKRLKTIPLYSDKYEYIWRIQVPPAIDRGPEFRFEFNKTFQCWRTIREFQKLGSDLDIPVNHLIDPNLFLESFKKDKVASTINGRLSKSLFRGTGLKSCFDQYFYINVDELRFRYNELEVFIVYTLKHLGQTFLNLSQTHNGYRFVYCREMLEDVVKASDYKAGFLEEDPVESVTGNLPVGVYCYRDIKDNSVHILHYIWKDTQELCLTETRGYWLREVIARCPYKPGDEISYSDLEFEKTDRLITKFEINN